MDKNTLSMFLRTLAHKVEDCEIDDKIIKKIGELYMFYHFVDDMHDKDDDDQLLKYLAAGWYIYDLQEKMT